MKDAKKYLAELIGTFALVFIGCGSVVMAGEKIGFLGIALAFGVTVLVMVYAIGSISGCHINPAITVSMLVAGRIKIKDTIAYVIAQCLGAVLASYLVLVIARGRAGYISLFSGLGQNGYGVHSPMGYSLVACFIAEIIFTAIFLFVIFGSTTKDAPKGFAGIAIGLTLTILHLVGIPVTGLSVNPARSLGPALLVGGDALAQVWLFWVAPLIGGVATALVWKNIFEKE